MTEIPPGMALWRHHEPRSGLAPPTHFIRSAESIYLPLEAAVMKETERRRQTAFRHTRLPIDAKESQNGTS